MTLWTSDDPTMPDVSDEEMEEEEKEETNCHQNGQYAFERT